jgi:hypothetical protein
MRFCKRPREGFSKVVGVVGVLGLPSSFITVLYHMNNLCFLNLCLNAFDFVVTFKIFETLFQFYVTCIFLKIVSDRLNREQET